jgi:hypothetical protein
MVMYTRKRRGNEIYYIVREFGQEGNSEYTISHDEFRKRMNNQRDQQEGGHMARVVTIQQPVYAVEATVEDFLNAFPKISRQDPRAVAGNYATGVAPKSPLTEAVYKALFERSVGGNLKTVVQVPCASQTEANLLKSIITPTVTDVYCVPSFTNYAKTYDVTCENGIPVSCSCPNYDPDKGGNPNCKHMKAVASRPSRYTKIR